MNITKGAYSYIKNTGDNFDERWIDLLCRYGNRKDFEFLRQNSNSTRLAIMRYRRILRNQGYGNVCKHKLQETYTNKQYNELHSMFEHMFLEFIPDDNFKYIISELDKRENGIAELFLKHTQNKHNRILTVVLML